jgi:putative colanic acid biosynthesis glycosyltransferase
MKFSIITVTLNNHSGLVATFNSVINQTFSDYEFIVIDGLSVDKTQEFVINNSKFISKYISEKDEGIYDAMNKGIKHSIGDYLIFLNAGDTFASDNILKKISKLSKPIYDFIWGDSLELLGDRKYYKKSKSHKLFWYGMITHHQSMIYSAKLIRKMNINYDLNFKIASDYKFSYSIFKSSKSFLKLDFPVSIFQIGGISSTNVKLGLQEQVQIKKDLCFPMYQILISTFLHFFSNYIRKNFKSFYYGTKKNKNSSN